MIAARIRNEIWNSPARRLVSSLVLSLISVPGDSLHDEATQRNATRSTPAPLGQRRSPKAQGLVEGWGTKRVTEACGSLVHSWRRVVLILGFSRTAVLATHTPRVFIGRNTGFEWIKDIIINNQITSWQNYWKSTFFWKYCGFLFFRNCFEKLFFQLSISIVSFSTIEWTEFRILLFAVLFSRNTTILKKKKIVRLWSVINWKTE